MYLLVEDSIPRLLDADSWGDETSDSYYVLIKYIR